MGESQEMNATQRRRADALCPTLSLFRLSLTLFSSTAGSDPLTDATQFEQPKRWIPGMRSSAYAAIFALIFALGESAKPSPNPGFGLLPRCNTADLKHVHFDSCWPDRARLIPVPSERKRP